MKALLDTLKIAWRMARRPRRAAAAVEQGNFWHAQCKRAYEEATEAFQRGDLPAFHAATERVRTAHRRMNLETEELFR